MFDITIDPMKEERKNLSSFSIDRTESFMQNLEGLPTLSVNQIEDLVRAVLEGKFISGPKTDIVRYRNRLNFACPYCEDSNSDNTKKRGNIYLEGYNFHCYNCGIHRGIHSFLQKFSNLSSVGDDQLAIARGIQAAGRQASLERKTRVFNEAILDPQELVRLSVSRNDLKSAHRFIEVTGSVIQAYLEKRLQDDPRNFLYDPRGNNLVILNHDGTGEHVIGYQTRSMGPRRFFSTYVLEKIRNDLGYENMTEDPGFSDANNLSMAFGIMTVQLDRAVTIFEGPLDSFHFSNSIALTGALKELPFDSSNIRFFFDYDVTGRDASLRRIQEGYPVFLWRRYLEENGIVWSKGKMDLNDLMIYQRRKGIQLAPLEGYFSNDRLDAVFI